MKKIIILLVLIVVIVSCSTKKKTLSDECITSLKPEPNEPQLLSSMIKSVRFIPLETTEQSLIGRLLMKIKKINNKYYVSFDFKELLEFDENGKFIKKIGRIGGGPGEYVELDDFDVFENGNIIIEGVQKLIFYDKDGKYQHTVELEFMPGNMKLVQNNRILIFGSGTEYGIHEVDLSGKIIKKELKMNLATKNYKLIHFVNYGQDKTITQIGNSNEFIFYDFNGKNFSYTKLLCDDGILNSVSDEKLWQTTSDFKDVYKNIQDKAIFRVAGTNSHLFFWYGHDNDIKSQVLNIETGNIEHVISNKDINDITFVEPSNFITGSARADAQDCFITYVYLSDVRKGLDKYSEFADNPNYKKLKELLMNKSEEEIDDENPVLVEFVFK
jgi:hypothetical protein